MQSHDVNKFLCERFNDFGMHNRVIKEQLVSELNIKSSEDMSGPVDSWISNRESQGLLKYHGKGIYSMQVSMIKH